MARAATEAGEVHGSKLDEMCIAPPAPRRASALNAAVWSGLVVLAAAAISPEPALPYVLALAIPPWIYAWVRSFRRLKIVLSDEGVLICNYWNQWYAPWSEIEEITLGASSPGWITSQPTMAFRSPSRGTSVDAHATSCHMSLESRQELYATVRRYARAKDVRFNITMKGGQWSAPEEVEQ